MKSSSLVNGLLTSLEPAALERLMDYLKPVDLKVHQILYKPGQHIATTSCGSAGPAGASFTKRLRPLPSVPTST